MSAQESAEMLALNALGWLAGQPELLTQFLAASGASLEDLPGAAARPDFLGALLDFVLMEDAWVIGFCDAQGLPYTAPMQARAALPGGPGPHWT